MEYLCDLKGEELSKLDVDELRTKLYKIKEEDLSPETLFKIDSHFMKEGVKGRFSNFLNDYKIELYRKERAEVSRKENAILEKERKEKEAERKKKDDIQREIERKNSLKYWLEMYPERFEKGTFIIQDMCYSTYPCHHATWLEFENESGIKEYQSFSSYCGGGREILEVLKKYRRARWQKAFSHHEENTTHPLEHFKNYENEERFSLSEYLKDPDGSVAPSALEA